MCELAGFFHHQLVKLKSVNCEYRSRLHPVWLLTAEVATAGRFSLMFTWKARQIPAQPQTHPSAMPPIPSRSLPKDSGASTPPATCDVLGSQGRVLASSQRQQTWRRPRAAPPPQSPSLEPLPPLSVKLRVATLEISQARVITSACLCLPSLRKRTGSLWSQPNTWSRPPHPLCSTGWLQGHGKARRLF